MRSAKIRTLPSHSERVWGHGTDALASSELLRVLCDEHIPYPVIAGLRRRELDVVSVQELGLSSSDDETILDEALNHNRVVYACDTDFLRLHSKGRQHTGILYHITRVFEACAILTEAETANKVVFL